MRRCSRSAFVVLCYCTAMPFPMLKAAEMPGRKRYCSYCNSSHCKAPEMFSDAAYPADMAVTAYSNIAVTQSCCEPGLKVYISLWVPKHSQSWLVQSTSGHWTSSLPFCALEAAHSPGCMTLSAMPAFPGYSAPAWLLAISYPPLAPINRPQIDQLSTHCSLWRKLIKTRRKVLSVPNVMPINEVLSNGTILSGKLKFSLFCWPASYLWTPQMDNSGWRMPNVSFNIISTNWITMNLIKVIMKCRSLKYNIYWL